VVLVFWHTKQQFLPFIKLSREIPITIPTAFPGRAFPFRAPLVDERQTFRCYNSKQNCVTDLVFVQLLGNKDLRAMVTNIFAMVQRRCEACKG